MDRILIANRGEIACRIIRSIQQLGKTAIAVYSEADAEAPHRYLADEAYPIGPAPAPQSYLDIDAILQAAAASRAQGVHPGYGFLSENANFVTRCDQAGLTFIGPSSHAMQVMGDKSRARQLAQETGVPVIPGSGPEPLGLEQARATAETLGYPVLLKAGGGGGIGMQVVTSPDDLDKAFETAQNRAQSAFGKPALYLEKFLNAPRHIEVQVLGDIHGNYVHLYERECSIQRRHQKILEEAPSFYLAAPQHQDIRHRLTQAALAIAAVVTYTNAGTIEFLVDTDDRFYFIEMNTRLQVEHTGTEMITGTDLVAEQIRIAEGATLSWSQSEINVSGASIECRIYAENPAKNYLPSPGKIEALRFPTGPGLRIDSGIGPGLQITPYYDPMLAKVTTHGRDRSEAIERMRQALSTLTIDGLQTNIALHRQILDNADFRMGRVATDFLTNIF